MQIDDGNDFLIIYNGGSEKGEMIEKLTGKLNKTISILGNQIFVVLNTNETITRQRSFNVKILESMFFSNYYVNYKTIWRNAKILIFQFLAEKCQYWLNETAGTLTSPNFDSGIKKYDHNLECLWIISADLGSYITLEIHNFYVMTNLLICNQCSIGMFETDFIEINGCSF